MIILQCFIPSLSYFLPSTLWFPPTQLLPKLPGGLLNVFCPFLKCCTVMLPYASQNPSLWFALPLPPHIFDPVHENPAAFCSSLRSINSEVQQRFVKVHSKLALDQFLQTLVLLALVDTFYLQSRLPKPNTLTLLYCKRKLQHISVPLPLEFLFFIGNNRM